MKCQKQNSNSAIPIAVNCFHASMVICLCHSESLFLSYVHHITSFTEHELEHEWKLKFVIVVLLIC